MYHVPWACGAVGGEERTSNNGREEVGRVLILLKGKGDDGEVRKKEGNGEKNRREKGK